MCLAVVGRVVRLDGQSAWCELDGTLVEARLGLLDCVPEPGDYLMIHAGFAMQRLDVEAAEESLAMLRDMLASQAPGGKK